MKLITLNTWGGRLPQIDDFITRHSADTDVFCFQEIYSNGSSEANLSLGERANYFEELQQLLPDFVGFFTEQVPHVGLATFVRKSITIDRTDSQTILSAEDMINYTDPDGIAYYPRIVQTVVLGGQHLTILNFHGLPGKNKDDCPERELQMTHLQKILDSLDGEIVLVGDFNLSPTTEAIRGLEKGMRNLVIDGGFKSTRTHHYAKFESIPYADYVFVTPGIEVKDLQVLTDEVSDHSPVQLDFK